MAKLTWDTTTAITYCYLWENRWHAWCCSLYMVVQVKIMVVTLCSLVDRYLQFGNQLLPPLSGYVHPRRMRHTWSACFHTPCTIFHTFRKNQKFEHLFPSSAAKINLLWHYWYMNYCVLLVPLQTKSWCFVWNTHKLKWRTHVFINLCTNLPQQRYYVYQYILYSRSKI
jgi:hypothetical protein